MNDVLDSPVESLLAKLQKAEDKLASAESKLERLTRLLRSTLDWAERANVVCEPEDEFAMESIRVALKGIQ